MGDVVQDLDFEFVVQCEGDEVPVRVHGGQVRKGVHAHPNAPNLLAMAPSCQTAAAQLRMLVRFFPDALSFADHDGVGIGELVAQVTSGAEVAYKLEHSANIDIAEELITRGDLFLHRTTISWPDGPTSLLAGPFKTILRTIRARPVLRTIWAEEGTEVELECPEAVVEHLPDLLSGPLTDETIVVAGELWTTYERVWLPEWFEGYGIAMWDSGDDYDVPGGDYTTCVERIGNHYVAFTDSDGWQYLGRYNSQRKAIQEWRASYVP